jgi:Bacterial Ig domain
MSRAVGRRKKRFRWSVVLAVMLIGVVAAVAGSSFGAELVTAEVTGTANDVTVTQGSSTTSTINLSASGAIACTITASNASTATVDTSYSLSSAGALSSGTPSSTMKFYSNGVAGGESGNCGVTWDGAPTPYSVTATFSAAAATPVGNYTVTLSAGAGTTDETNPSVAGGKLGDATPTTVTVHVVAPVVTNTSPTVKTAAPDANGNEGDTLQTSGAFADADGDSISVSKTAGGGSVTDNGGGSWSWSLPTTDQTSGSVTVTADDGHGNTATDTFNYSAVNVAPTAAITGAPSTSPEGTQISLGSTVTDPSSADTSAGFTYAWSVAKDGNPYGSGSSATFSFTPDDDGTYVVSFSATDKDGATGQATDATITVTNVAPTGTFNAPAAHVSEGSSFSLSIGGVTDPSSVDTAAGFEYAFDCGDGSGYSSFSSSSSVTCNSAVDGPATLNVGGEVEDKDGGVSTYSGTVSVDNVAPTVGTLSVGGASGTACTGGNSVTLDFGFTDPGVNDAAWAVDISWGDGSHTAYNASTQGSQPQHSHSYGAGAYTISVSVTDKDGGVGSGSTPTNAVSHFYSMTGILQPINSNGSSVFKYGSTIPVKVQILDCSGAPVSNLAPQIGTQLKSTADPAASIDEVTSTSAADTGTTLRYDATSGQYIYNLASKSLVDGSATYYVYVRESHSVGQTPTGGPSTGQSYQQFALKLK